MGDRIIIECSPEFKLKVKMRILELSKQENKKLNLKEYVTQLILNDLK